MRIHFINLSNLITWSLPAATTDFLGNQSAYYPRKLGSFLMRAKKNLLVEDNKLYKRVTIRLNGGGIILRDTEFGRNIGTKRQFLIKPGQLLISRIDAQNGAMGLVPNELDHSIVTSDFLPFNIDTSQVNPQYLNLIISTRQFLDLCITVSSNAVNRQRINEEQFLELSIPLPSLNEQDRLLSAYYETTNKAHEKREKAADATQKFKKYLLAELGIKTVIPAPRIGGLNFVYYSKLYSWGTNSATRNRKLETTIEEQEISNLVESFMRGTNGEPLRIQTTKNLSSTPFYIGMEDVEKGTGKLINPNISGRDIKGQVLRVPPNFFIYGKLRPYLNKFWHNRDGKINIVCSPEFFVFSLLKFVNPLYFNAILGSEIISLQIEEESGGNHRLRMSESAFLSMRIPLPTFDKQAEIATYFEYTQEKIDILLASAELLESLATAEFEKDIFGTPTYT